MLEGLRWRVYAGGSTLPNIYSIDQIHPPQVECIQSLADQIPPRLRRAWDFISQSLYMLNLWGLYIL